MRLSTLPGCSSARSRESGSPPGSCARGGAVSNAATQVPAGLRCIEGAQRSSLLAANESRAGGNGEDRSRRGRPLTAGTKEPWWFFSPAQCTQQRISIGIRSARASRVRHVLRITPEQSACGWADVGQFDGRARYADADELPSPVSAGLESLEDMVAGGCVEFAVTQRQCWISKLLGS